MVPLLLLSLFLQNSSAATATRSSDCRCPYCFVCPCPASTYVQRLQERQEEQFSGAQRAGNTDDDCQRYGLNLEQLISANNINPHLIYAGQV